MRFKAYAMRLPIVVLAGCGALHAAIIQDVIPFGSISGSGLGSVSTVLTQQSPGNTTFSNGCSFWTGSASATGTGCPANGFGGNEQAQNNTFTVGQLGITDFSELRIIFNASDPGNQNNSVTLSSLVLLLMDPTTGNLPAGSLAAFSLGSSVFFPTVAQGTGNSGFFFTLDGAGVTAANAFWSSLSNTANLRIGLAATISNTTGGHDTFFVARGEGGGLPPQAEIPEPATMALTGLGLLAAAIVRKRTVKV